MAAWDLLIIGKQEVVEDTMVWLLESGYRKRGPLDDSTNHRNILNHSKESNSPVPLTGIKEIKVVPAFPKYLNTIGDLPLMCIRARL